MANASSGCFSRVKILGNQLRLSDAISGEDSEKAVRIYTQLPPEVAAKYTEDLDSLVRFNFFVAVSENNSRRAKEIVEREISVILPKERAILYQCMYSSTDWK